MPTTTPRPARWCAFALALGALTGCAQQRQPRPTLLNVPPPLPPPGPDEVRLMPLEVVPEGPEPEETPPGSSLTQQARRALDAVRPDLLQCYYEVLLLHPTAHGSIELQLDLAPSGSVTRAHVDQQGEEGFEGILACAREVARAVRIREVTPRGEFLSRIYNFRTQALARVAREPLAFEAPPRAPAGRGRRRANPDEALTPGEPPPPPSAAPGPLRTGELTAALGALPALRACAPLALRGPLRAGATGTLRFVVAPDGALRDVRYEPVARSAPVVVPCVVEAVSALRVRPSGLTVNAEVPVAFRPAPAPARAPRR